MDKKYKSLLNEFCHAQGILSPSYRCSAMGPAHSPSFVATLKLQGNEYKSSLHPNKKSAEEDVATKAYIDLMSQREHVSSQQQEILPEEKGGSKLWRQNLYEWCQKTHRGLPTFNFGKSGPDHNPLFQATVELMYEDKLLKFQSTPQFKKKQAEEDVAEIAIKFLRNKIISKSSGDSSSNTDPVIIANSNSNNSSFTIITNTNTNTDTNTLPSPTHSTNTNLSEKKKISFEEFQFKFKPPAPDLSQKPEAALINYCTQHFGKSPELIKKPSSKGIWKFKISLLGYLIGEGRNQDKKMAVKEGFENCSIYIKQMLKRDDTTTIEKSFWYQVFNYLCVSDLLRFGLTNKYWLNFACEHKVWENICRARYPDSDPNDEDGKSKWIRLFSLMTMSDLQENWQDKLQTVWDGKDFEEEVIGKRENYSFWRYISFLRDECVSLMGEEENTSLDPYGLFEIHCM